MIAANRTRFHLPDGPLTPGRRSLSAEPGLGT